MKNVSLTDTSVQLLRILACFLVIGTHIKLTDLPSALPGHEIDVSRIFIAGIFSSVGVTIFFMVTGFFLFNAHFAKIFKKLFKSILLPAFLYILISNFLYNWIVGNQSLIICFTNPRLDYINIIKNILNWNSFGIALSPHLWYIFEYCKVVLWF